ncbi:hypothetical protein [Streptomyces sp. NBC_01794]|uniref:hypothetical protein n=1 Tax=Streptomyces sp. NBC_01794 TaxID=2975942 RepID=UPI00308679A0|nr:hypothetical protein OIE54_12260 [Streptomyces sp. NBC_01794]
MAADTAPAPDLTPTERAIANMRHLRQAAGYPITGDQWLLLNAYDQLEVALREKTTLLANAEKRLEQMDAALTTADAAIDDAYAIPGREAIA